MMHNNSTAVVSRRRNWKPLATSLAAVPILAVAQTRIDSISNPGPLGLPNPQVGAHNVAMHFSTLLIIGVVVPLWGMFALMLVREAYSWFDRVVTVGRSS